MNGNGATRVLERLKLRAADMADLQVISTCLQDALTSVGEMTFLPRRRRFVMLASRFMWERQQAASADGERVRAGLRFQHVLGAQVLGIEQHDRRGLLSLLAITATERADGVDIVLRFAGGGVVRLLAECIDCQLADLSRPWPTPHRPLHAIEEPAAVTAERRR